MLREFGEERDAWRIAGAIVRERGKASIDTTGRLAKIVVSEAVDNQKAFEGRLRGVEDGAVPGDAALGDAAPGVVVLLEGPRGRMHRLPMRLIARGRLEVEF